MSVREFLSSANISESRGSLNINGTYSLIFDNIILDPPRSALGLRPKLCVDIKCLSEIINKC